MGVGDLQVREQDNVLYINENENSAATKDALWEVYEKIDPEFGSADVVMNINAPEVISDFQDYTVQSGDNLSKIGRNNGVTWQAIFEANKDIISNPDLIQVGWKLKTPKA